MNHEEREKRIESLDDLKRIRFNTSKNTMQISLSTNLIVLCIVWSVLVLSLFFLAITNYKFFLGTTILFSLIDLLLWGSLISGAIQARKKEEEFLLTYGRP